MQSLEDTFGVQIGELDNLMTFAPDHQKVDQQYLVFMRAKDLPVGKQRVLELRVTNCLDFYLEANVTEAQLLEHKRKIGFEGNWSSYLSLLKKAVQRVNRGSIEVAHMPDQGLELRICYPVSETVKISGCLGIVGTEDLPSKERRRRVQRMVYELYSRYDEEKRKLEARIEELERYRDAHLPSNDKGPGLGVGMLGFRREEKKRKYKANLINPNVKKKKRAIGAKFGDPDN